MVLITASIGCLAPSDRWTYWELKQKPEQKKQGSEYLSHLIQKEFVFLKMKIKNNEIYLYGDYAEEVPVGMYVKDGLVTVIKWKRPHTSESQKFFDFIKRLKNIMRTDGVMVEIRSYAPLEFDFS